MNWTSLLRTTLLGCGIASGCAPGTHPRAIDAPGTERPRQATSNLGASNTDDTSGAFLPGRTTAPDLDALAPALLPKTTTEAQFSLSSSSMSGDGESFWLAAHFQPPPGAHIYWENPGESGLATTVEFEAPAGVDISPPGYPGPERFMGEAHTVSYGYGGPTTLLSRATLTAQPTASLWVEASASWLSCREVCVRERATARIDLRHTEPKDMTAHLVRLPVPAEGRVAGEWLDESRLRFQPSHGIVLHEFFPRARLGPADSDCINTPLDDGALLVDLRYAEVPRGVLSGVIRATWEGMRRYVDVSVAPRDASTTPLP